MIGHLLQIRERGRFFRFLNTHPKFRIPRTNDLGIIAANNYTVRRSTNWAIEGDLLALETSSFC
jgi:hypothetical protein